jgi:V/A-type H+-transporting ATPase subunit E
VSDKSVTDDLEAALLRRARKLADEHLAHARNIHDQVIEEENQRLRLREEREVLAAKEVAERLYRQRVQASELRLREQLERRRWELIESAMTRLADRLGAIAGDEDEYLPVLQALLRDAAARIPAAELVAEVNARDMKRLRSGWDEITREAAEGKTISMDSEALQCSGGVRVSDKDNRVRVDNTFEGRLERMSDILRQVISEHLFAAAAEPGDSHGG